MSIFRIRKWDEKYENHRTRSLKNLQWVPVPNDLLNEKYLELIDHENGAAHLGVWLSILQIASTQGTRGVLPGPRAGKAPDERGEVAGLARALSRISRLSIELYEEALPRLLDLEWIEQVDEQRRESAGKAPDERQIAAEIKPLKGREGKGIEQKGREPEEKGIESNRMEPSRSALVDYSTEGNPELPNDLKSYPKAEALAIKNAVEEYKHYGGEDTGELIVCDPDLYGSLLRKGRFYRMTGFQIAAALHRALFEVQRKPSLWPESKGWFIHVVEEAGKTGNGRPH